MASTDEFRLSADYHQFYVQDEWSNPALEDVWSEEATNRMLATESGWIGVGTARETTVPVTVVVADDAPALDHTCDLAVEASIELPSGRLIVAGCTDYRPEAARISLSPGIYRLRATFRGLDTLSADGLDGDDRYEVALWSASEVAPVTVLIDRRGAP